MQQRRKIRYLIAFVLLMAGILVLLLCNIRNRNGENSTGRNFNHRRAQEGMNAKILWEIRFPRTLAAAILGGALALAGYLLQTFFHNPIAGPFVLGISSGAKMVVALVMVFCWEYDPGQLRTADPGGISGCYAVHGICASYGAKGGQYVHVGGQRCDDRLHLFCHYGAGGDVCGGCGHRESPQLVAREAFSGMTWDNVKVMSIVVAVTFLMVILLAKPLELTSWVRRMHRIWGVNIRTLRILLVVLSSVLSACIVAFAGPISLWGSPCRS